MHNFTRYRRGLLAAAVAVVLTAWGCSTTAPHDRQAARAGGSGQLTPAEDRHARALAHYASALLLASEQGLPAAIDEYRQACELNPGNLPLALWLAQYYRDRHDPTNSFAIINLAAQANPKSGEPWVARGLTYQSLDNQTNAIAAFKQALKVDPAYAGAVHALVDAYMRQNDTKSLVTVLDQAFRIRTNDDGYWTTLGDLYNQILHLKPSLASRLDHTRSRLCYEKALSLAPYDPEILARVGAADMDINNFKAAAEVYARLIELRPNVPQLREQLADIYVKTDQKDKAVALYKELIKRDPLRYEFYNELGALEEDLDKPEDALNYYEQSLKLNPDQSTAYVNICELQRLLKRPADALATLDAWKKKFPTDWRVPYMHALIETANKEYAKAVASYADTESMVRESSSQDMPLTSQFYFGYGAACERAGDFPRAVPLFRKAIELDPKSANAYNYLGYMWADKGTNLTESLEMIQKAVGLEPDNSAYLDSLGWVYNKLGRTTEALTQLQHAIELLKKEEKPEDDDDRQENAVVYDHLAEVLLKLGRRSEAIQQWKEALTLDPANKEIADKLQKYNADHTAAPK